MRSNTKNKFRNMILLQVFFLLLGVIAFTIVKTNTNVELGICPVKSAIGIPCPSCGGTRCIINLVNLNVVDSFKYHPVVFGIIFYILIADFVYVINTLLKNDKLSFLYKSMIPFYIFLCLFILQYLIRVICCINGVESSIMFMNV